MKENNIISLHSSFANYLLKIIPRLTNKIYILNNELIVYTDISLLYQLVFFLRYHTYCMFNSISDICGVDFPSRAWRFEVVYNFLSTFYNARIRVKVKISDAHTQFVPSIVSIFPGANWYERETWDMFGIFFENHPDLRRILTDYGFEGFPLRKDFPLSGYLELRYSEVEKRITYEPVQFAQEYRFFDFGSSWPKEASM